MLCLSDSVYNSEEETTEGTGEETEKDAEEDYSGTSCLSAVTSPTRDTFKGGLATLDAGPFPWFLKRRVRGIQSAGNFWDDF